MCIRDRYIDPPAGLDFYFIASTLSENIDKLERVNTNLYTFLKDLLGNVGKPDKAKEGWLQITGGTKDRGLLPMFTELQNYCLPRRVKLAFATMSDRPLSISWCSYDAGIDEYNGSLDRISLLKYMNKKIDEENELDDSLLMALTVFLFVAKLDVKFELQSCHSESDTTIDPAKRVNPCYPITLRSAIGKYFIQSDRSPIGRTYLGILSDLSEFGQDPKYARLFEMALDLHDSVPNLFNIDYLDKNGDSILAYMCTTCLLYTSLRVYFVLNVLQLSHPRACM